jgi:hypothetical protein
MAEKIELLNGAALYFKNTGVEISYEKNKFNIPYINLDGFAYFSLIILTAKENNLNKAKEIIAKYGDLVPIREIIIVGNTLQDPEEIETSKTIKFLVHKKKRTPIITSVKEALSCISNFSQFAIICPASKRCIEAENVEKMMKIALQSNQNFLVPSTNHRKAHPVIIRRDGFEEIKSVRKELGLKYISRKFFKEVSL